MSNPSPSNGANKDPLKPLGAPHIPRARATVPPWQLLGDYALPSAPRVAPSNAPPPLPSRGIPFSHSPHLNPYNAPYASSFPVSPFSPYSSPFYGSYGRSFAPDSVASPFAHFANENARPAFQSVEALVNAVRSVSFMVESTYQAVHSSFLAVLGVADHFSRLKDHLAAIVSSLSLLRFFKWILDQLSTFLRLKRRPSAAASDWSETFDAVTPDRKLDSKGTKSATAWPLIAFFGIAIGAPWVVWKLLRAYPPPPTRDNESWVMGAGEHYVAKADFDFRAGADDELSFGADDLLKVAPKRLQPSNSRGWLLASKDGVNVGLVPANYVQVLVKREK